MYLTSTQWAAVRRVAAEHARGAITNHETDVTELIAQGYDLSQIQEVLRIARSTAAKTAASKDRELRAAITIVTKKLGHLGDQLPLFGPDEPGHLITVQKLRELIAPPKPREPEPEDGTRELRNGETWAYTHASGWHRPLINAIPGYCEAQDGDVRIFNRKNEGPIKYTFFMGQWRTDSELQSFASAKKYL